MTSKQTINRITDNIVRVELATYGKLLDDMEANRRPMHPARYRSASVFAMKLILQFNEVPATSSVCANSPALTELIETHQLGLSIRRGTISPYLIKRPV
jgi:hypothetical protein